MLYKKNVLFLYISNSTYTTITTSTYNKKQLYSGGNRKLTLLPPVFMSIMLYFKHISNDIFY